MPSLDSSPRAAQQLHMLVSESDLFLRQIWLPRTSNIQFQVDGLLFHASYTPQANGVRIQLWSTLGYLPYSAESPQRRRILINLLEQLQQRACVQFGINRGNQIIVTQTYETDGIQPPTFLFPPIVHFIQASMPYIRLMGECL